jgi:hypothetical protein
MKHLQIYESFTGRSLSVEDDPRIKNGVDSLFEKFPRLARIGTPAQYSQYLDTIFPNSKVKDILYHSSPSKFTRFKDPASSGLSHIWFSEEPLDSQFGSNVYPVVVNLQNPLMQNHPDYNKGLRSFESPLNPDWVNNYDKTGELPRFKYDGTIRSCSVDSGRSITVRNPSQIHILGSAEDIEGFIQYIST